MKYVLCFIILIGFYNCTFAQVGKYTIVYEADEYGEPVSGSLDTLIKLVKEGNNVRVGWEVSLNLKGKEPLIVEHWADAGFLTVLNGHLFGQVQGIFEQAPAPMTPVSYTHLTLPTADE